MKDSPIFAFAGLYDMWHDVSGDACPTYTIITTEANELVAPLHNRMPVILKRTDENRWLSGDAPSQEEMGEILRPYPSDEMMLHPVSSRVNSPAIDDERLIQPLETF